MPTMMTQLQSLKKEILAVLGEPIELEQPRRGRARSSAEINLDRRMLTVFARVVGEDGNVPSKGVYKIRAGEQHPWRVLCRRLREAHEAKASEETLLAIIDEMRRWMVEDLFAKSRKVPA